MRVLTLDKIVLNVLLRVALVLQPQSGSRLAILRRAAPPPLTHHDRCCRAILMQALHVEVGDGVPQRRWFR